MKKKFVTANSRLESASLTKVCDGWQVATQRMIRKVQVQFGSIVSSYKC